MAERLVEGHDYYREGERIVFTAAYLKRRGYCCLAGCRHCPFADGRAAADILAEDAARRQADSADPASPKPPRAPG